MRRVRALACGLLAALVLAWSTGAGAQTSTGIAADRFVPGVGPGALLGVEGAETTPFKQMSWATSIGYLRDPIKLSNAFTGQLVSRPVRGQLTLDGAIEAGVWRWLAVAVGVPFRLWATGDRLQGVSDDARPLARAAAGDLRLRVKAAFIGDPARRGLHLAALVQLTAPLGGEADFAATDGVTVEPRLVADLRYGPVVVAAQVGARFQTDRALFGTRFGDALVWQAGVGAEAFKRGALAGGLIAEFAGEVGPGPGSRPVEVRGGVRLRYRRAELDLAAGGGLDGDTGAPRWRLLAVVRQQFNLVKDNR